MGGFSWEAFESSKIFQTLYKLTEEPTGAFTPSDALHQVHELTMAEIAENRGKSDPAGILPECVADVLTELACRTDPADQGRLVAFASQLYQKTEYDPETGEPLMQDGRKVWDENVSLLISANRIWRDQLGHEDWGGVFDIETCLDDLNLASKKKQRWVNLIAFTAQLSQAAPPEPRYKENPLNWAHMALWSLRAAFEADISPDEIVGTTTFQVACFWFIYAANAVWAYVENEIEAGGPYISSPGPQYKHRDWKGFNRERWDVWVQALEHSQTRCHDSNRETMSIIVDALGKAKAAEKGN